MAERNRIALLWRGDREARSTATPDNNRLQPVFAALAERGIAAEPAVYSDAMAAEVRDQLLRVDGALVWVDPIGGGEDRTKLDALLRDVSSAGVWVSAHPDTILAMGTKEVLYRTRDFGWGTDTDLYTTLADFEKRFPARLAGGQPRVLKQYHGNGGIGVWKVELTANGPTNALPPTRGLDAIVRVQHAAPRDAVTEDLTLGAFIGRCTKYFAGAGRLIDQPFMARLPEGMIRAYLVQSEVIGFARQQPRDPTADSTAPRPDKVLGLPAAKTMYEPAEPEFATLKAKLETEWVPSLQRSEDIGTMPLLWDADFLYGPKTDDGDDYVLCEINVSSVYPFPGQAPRKLAAATLARLTSSRRS